MREETKVAQRHGRGGSGKGRLNPEMGSSALSILIDTNITTAPGVSYAHPPSPRLRRATISFVFAMLFPAELPPELVFHTLSYLSIRSLEALRGLSREWSALFTEHEAYIYRNAAFKHGFISAANATLDDAVKVGKPFLSDSEPGSWSALCRSSSSCHRGSRQSVTLLF